ncbi:MAG: SAM-dependent methyltransferase [Bacteroidetes bacterium]|nr:SAM-dependent methyltransferase [Bacteroidota bacterium]
MRCDYFKNQNKVKGILYLIPVPIAEDDNPDLVYPLLKKTIDSLEEFIVEDLKTARRALRKIGFKGEFDKCIFHILNEHTDLKGIEKFLSSAEKGKSIGLMSEAGMPCIADPGSDIVRLAHQKNIKVIPLYGQSSIFLALAASGLNGQNFCFYGYLPKSQNERKKKLKELCSSPIRVGASCTHIFIETPYRNNHLLEDILSTCSPETLLCIAVNITGSSEKIITRSIADWKKSELPHLDKQPTVFLLGR